MNITDERLGKIITALLLADFDGIPSERLPEALKDLKVELVGLGICAPEEAEAVTQKVLEMIHQKEQAQLFARQYPSNLILRARAQDAERRFGF